MSKVILITGASSGIGFTTAKSLAEQGYKVYGAARRVEKMEELKQYGVTPIKMDVTSEESVNEAVEQVIAAEKRIDVLVNNAGYGSYGAVEDVSIDEARRQFEVNVFGLAILTKKVLPYMRQQHSGTIINVSSMGGRLTTYFGAWYHATKYAVEAFSDALRMEVSDFGIRAGRHQDRLGLHRCRPSGGVGQGRCLREAGHQDCRGYAQAVLRQYDERPQSHLQSHLQGRQCTPSQDPLPHRFYGQANGLDAYHPAHPLV